jgi:hypothetical protein
MSDLLDRHEAGTVSPIGYPDYASFANVSEIDRFAQELGEAERSGAVKIAKGRGRNSDQIAHVRLEAASRLYTLLGRRPVKDLADEAASRLMNGLDLPAEFEAAAASILATWSRGRVWQGFSLNDVDRVRLAFALAMAILERKHQGIDYRTFSRRIAGDSKALERLEGPVVRLLASTLELPPNARPRDALRTLGLEKFAPPMLLSGRIDFDTAELAATAPLYFGIPPAEAFRLRFRQKPRYILTIENFASFNRHVAEADPAHAGLTIYIGGYPSLATQDALRSLAAAAPDDVRFFHWSDIDPDGTWIFRTIERVLGRPLTPHLMSVGLAEKFGKSPAEGVRSLVAAQGSSIASLVTYLQRADAKWLEQEELDPVVPEAVSTTSVLR